MANRHSHSDSLLATSPAFFSQGGMRGRSLIAASLLFGGALRTSHAQTRLTCARAGGTARCDSSWPPAHKRVESALEVEESVCMKAESCSCAARKGDRKESPAAGKRQEISRKFDGGGNVCLLRKQMRSRTRVRLRKRERDHENVGETDAVPPRFGRLMGLETKGEKR